MLQIKAKKDAELKERQRREKEKQDRLNRDPNVRMPPMHLPLPVHCYRIIIVTLRLCPLKDSLNTDAARCQGVLQTFEGPKAVQPTKQLEQLLCIFVVRWHLMCWSCSAVFHLLQVFSSSLYGMV